MNVSSRNVLRVAKTHSFAVPARSFATIRPDIPQRPEPAYPGHIPLSRLENAFLAVGSGLMSLANPRRGDMVAALGETTAGPSLPRWRDAMLADSDGRRVLRDRPRVNSDTVDMAYLASLPENTFGSTYFRWLERCGVTPDSRDSVHYINDPELAYVMQRYRECHDFYHAICGLPTSIRYELALKAFEFSNLGLPMSGLGALLGPLRLSSKHRSQLIGEYYPWALRCGANARNVMTVYWEEKWEMDADELRAQLGIWSPPPAVWPKKPLNEAAIMARRKAEERQRQQQVQEQ